MRVSNQSVFPSNPTDHLLWEFKMHGYTEGSNHCFCRTTESFRLEEPAEISKSTCSPSTAKATSISCPRVPHPHIFKSLWEWGLHHFPGTNTHRPPPELRLCQPDLLTNPCSVKPLCSLQQPAKPCQQPEIPLPGTADVPQGHCRAGCSQPARDKRLPLQHWNSQQMPSSYSLTEPFPGGASNANPQLRAVHHKSPALPYHRTQRQRDHTAGASNLFL